MKQMQIEQVIQAVEGICHGTPLPAGSWVADVVIDSRKAGPGALYIPIHGERFDGHDFIEDAFGAGALCVLSERPLDTAQPHIVVKDTLRAFQNLAKYYRELLPLRVVGITGSAGKTTTKELVAGVLSQAFRTLKTTGNLNNQTGVPLTVFQMEESHQMAVVEMGTNHFGEIAALSRIVSPDVCVLTNIGTAHIEHLESRAGILRAKCEMLEYMRPGGRVVVHGDDDMLRTLCARRKDVTTFGISHDNDVYAEQIRMHGLRGTDFTACWQDGRQEIHIPSPGEHMVQNALCALAVGLAFGMQPQLVAAGIAAYRPVGGRMAVCNAHGITVLDDTYNANPQSMLRALEVLKQADGRKVAVLGEMYELGDQAAQYHTQVGKAAQKSADVVLCVGDLAKHMQLGNARWFATQEALWQELGGLVRTGDTVLVKASRGMHLEHTVRRLLDESPE